jgi:hypothetical protein
MQDIKLTTEKNGPASLAILMAMRIRRYNAERISQYGRSRATLNPTGHRHWASICPVLPRGRHGHQFWRKKLSCGIVEITFQHETDPQLNSSKQQAA